ncbi:MAG: bifunctional hydroxymethylpyrimidine kinase/phosphomethylpyrimidine kinase [bacterium]
MHTALTIAGSDSGGGAGIQADLKTFHTHGVFGTSVITALTAQNTRGVSGIHPVPGPFVAEQYRQVVEDIGADAAKTGMLANAEVIGSVAEVLEEIPVPFLVVDPVMISKSGARLLEEDAVRALIERILPLATLVTPNLHEASALAGTGPIEDREGQMEAARRIKEMGPAWVLIKGGHLPAEDEAVDLLYNGEEISEYRAPRLDQRHTHGTGCTYSAAIAAGLAKRLELREAVARAKAYITEAIRTAPGLGGGVGPVNHFAPPPEGSQG